MLGLNIVPQLIQIASGVAYLHGVKPPVVHGDLKGGNILIDAHGQAIITDFGLSKVIEDFSTSVPELLGSSPLTAVPEPLLSSSFGGSARWMAPELIGCLLEDGIPQVTTETDVWAFGCVCLEVRCRPMLPSFSHSTDYYRASTLPTT